MTKALVILASIIYVGFVVFAAAVRTHQLRAEKADGTYVSTGKCVAYKFAVRKDTTFYEIQCTNNAKPTNVELR